MRKIFFISFFSCALALVPYLPAQMPLLIIDTNQKDPYVYSNPFEHIATSAGFKSTYYNIGTFLDTPEHQIQPSLWPVVFFIIDAPFLKNLATSHAAQKIVHIIHTFCSTPGAVIGFFFHPATKFTSQTETDFLILFKHIEGLNAPSILRTLLTHFLQNPLERRPRLYHTVLRAATHSIPAYRTTLSEQTGINCLSLCPTKGIHTTCFLPINQASIPKELAPVFPLGLYHFNKQHNNHIICSSSTFLTFSSVEENYHFCPSDTNMQQQICKTLQQFLWEINVLAHHRAQSGIDCDLIVSKSSQPFPSIPLQVATSDRTTTIHTPLVTAWMDIEIFENKEKKEEQKQLIKSIFDGNINALWITFSPAMFYSPQGKKKAHIGLFYNSIRAFTKELAQEAEKRKVCPPAILVDMEVSNNFEPPAQKPSSPAFDIFGNEYEKCPDPLDHTFWQQEVVFPLQAFALNWKHIGNGIPLSGVVLDLEMYFSPPGTFSSTMGFSSQTIQQFAKHIGVTINSRGAFVDFLTGSRNTNVFFSFLHDEAHKLGRYLRTEFEKILPHGLFGYYIDHLSSHWFYKGFSQGLSMQEHPILILSFNTNFKKHLPWLHKNDIYAEHASVLLLSKLQTKQDISYWLDLLCAHTGHVWINRFSRLVEPYPFSPQDPNAWTRAENTPLSWKSKETFLNQLALKQESITTDHFEPEKKMGGLFITPKKIALLVTIATAATILYKLIKRPQGQL